SSRKKNGSRRPGTWSSTDAGSATRDRNAPSARSSTSAPTRASRRPSAPRRDPPSERRKAEQQRVADDRRDRVDDDVRGGGARRGAHECEPDDLERADDRTLEQAVTPGYPARDVAAPDRPEPCANGRKTEEKPDCRSQY